MNILNFLIVSGSLGWFIIKQLALFALIANASVKQPVIAGEIMLKKLFIFFIFYHSLFKLYHIKKKMVVLGKNDAILCQNDKK